MSNISFHKPRLKAENLTLNLYYRFPDKDRPEYWTASVTNWNGTDRDNPIIINGVVYKTLRIEFTYKTYCNITKWYREHTGLYRDNFLTEATQNARNTICDAIIEYLNTNITQDDRNNAILEAYQQKIEHQLEYIQETQENLKLQQDTLDKYKEEYNNFQHTLNFRKTLSQSE